MPSTAVYLVSPRRIAAIAASLMLSGVSKSGSPAPSPITSRPAAFRSRAFCVTAMVGDGWMRPSDSARKPLGSGLDMTLGFAFSGREVSGGKPGCTRAKPRKSPREWPLLQIVNRKTAILAAPIRGVAMRTILALLLAALALAACSKPAPPQGRWEGAYDDGSTFIAARMEIGSD